MKGFRFRLDPVLRVRSHELDQRRQRLAAARSALARAEAAESERDRTAREAVRHVDERLQGGAEGSWLVPLLHGTARLVRAVERAGAETRRYRNRAEALRQETVRAHARVRGLELLRERALETHRREHLRRAQAELEDLARARAAWETEDGER